MPISSDTYDFSQSNVDKSPQQPGVYGLFIDQQLIYYGSATRSIRDRLQRHYSGAEGTCTRQATKYKREICSNPRAREKTLLEEYRRQNGRLPRCNDVMP